MFTDVKIALAGRLIDGCRTAPDEARALAAEYVIAVLKPAGGWIESSLCCVSDPALMFLRRDGAGVALVPDVDPERTRKVVGGLASCLPSAGWIAVAHRPVDQVAEGYREALDTLQLLEAGRRPGGTYRITDVLVEYAATREPVIAERLAALIRPLREHPVLWESLLAVIDAEHNRNQAARRLFVHRSTLDYRMRRIGEITGVDPGTAWGVQQLTIALIANSIRGS